jgi:hypothetical protein
VTRCVNCAEPIRLDQGGWVHADGDLFCDLDLETVEFTAEPSLNLEMKS